MVAFAGLPDPVDVVAGGETMHVRRFGAGPRLVWLHGGPGLDHHVLLPPALPLSDRFEVWLPDLPGHGGSPPRHPSRLGARELLQRFARWLAGVERDVGRLDLLIGHSMGAWLAREAIGASRIRPAGLILVSPPAGGRSRRSAVRQGLSLAPPAFRAAGPERERIRAREELLELVRADLGGEPSAATAAAIGRALIRPSWHYGKLLRQLHGGLVRPTRSVDPGCPVLVVCGEHDTVTPVEQAREIVRQTTGSTLELMAGSGHFPFAGDPAALVASIVAFYDRVSTK